MAGVDRNAAGRYVRTPRPPAKHRTEMVMVKLTPEEKTALRQSAAHRLIPMVELVRRAIRPYLKLDASIGAPGEVKVRQTISPEVRRELDHARASERKLVKEMELRIAERVAFEAEVTMLRKAIVELAAGAFSVDVLEAAVLENIQRGSYVV